MRPALLACLLAACVARPKRPIEPPPFACGCPPAAPSPRELERLARDVVTIVTAGERFWKSSCDVAGVEGLCVERGRAEGGCGPDGEHLIPRPRGASAEQARMHFRAALERYERAGLSGGDAEAAALTARLRLADDQLEALLRVGFPARLDFASAEDRALRELAAFRRDLEGRALGVRRAYGSLAGSAMGMTALSREVLLIAHIGELLRHARPPRGPSAEAGEFQAEFCATMAELAVPWDDAAARLRGECAEEASRRGEAPPVSCAR